MRKRCPRPALVIMGTASIAAPSLAAGTRISGQITYEVTHLSDDRARATKASSLHLDKKLGVGAVCYYKSAIWKIIAFNLGCHLWW